VTRQRGRWARARPARLSPTAFIASSSFAAMNGLLGNFSTALRFVLGADRAMMSAPAAAKHHRLLGVHIKTERISVGNPHLCRSFDRRRRTADGVASDRRQFHRQVRRRPHSVEQHYRPDLMLGVEADIGVESVRARGAQRAGPGSISRGVTRPAAFQRWPGGVSRVGLPACSRIPAATPSDHVYPVGH
jgi:hypothetical protein